MRKFGTWVVSAAALAMVIVSAAQDVQARPGYTNPFKEAYPNLNEKVGEAKCNVCHFGSKKTDRNDYGVALSEALGAKNVKDAAKITEALKAVESKPSSTEGKTFGELIKAGELPGKAP